MECCRICFNTDVRMVVLDSESVEKMFLECIFAGDGINEQLDDFLICYECKALLIKSCGFLGQALRAQQAFLRVWEQKEINTDTWKSLKNELGFHPVRSYHKVDIDVFLEVTTDDLKIKKENYPDTIMDNKIKSPNIKSPVLDINNGIDTSNVIILCDSDNETKELEPKPYVGVRGKIVGTNETSKSNKIKTQKTRRGKSFTEFYEIINSSSENEEHKNFTEVNQENIINKKRNHNKKKYSEFVASDSEVSDTTEKRNKRIPQKATKRGLIKRKKPEDEDFKPTDESSSSESDDLDCYNENGRRLQNPPRQYPRECEQCDSVIEAGKYHFQHYLFHHTAELYPYRRNGRYVCQYCGVKKAELCLLRVHEATHGEKKIACPLCDMKFHHTKALIRHRKNVHNKHSIFCDYCNKGFKLKPDLVLHIRTHTGEKPFKCHICKTGFAHRGNLNLHLKNGHHKLDDDGKPIPPKARSRKKNGQKRSKKT